MLLMAVTSIQAQGIREGESSSQADLRLNELEYFERQGVNILVFSNSFNGGFNDEKNSGIEIIHHGVRTVQGGAVPAPVAETDIEAGVGINFKIEVPVFSLGHEEKLQAAVLTDRGEGSRIFSAALFLHCAQVDIQIPGIVAELPERPNTAVRPPEDLIRLQQRDGIPVRSTGDRSDQIASDCFFH